MLLRLHNLTRCRSFRFPFVQPKTFSNQTQKNPTLLVTEYSNDGSKWKLVELPKPVPTQNEVTVEIQYANLNFLDILRSNGYAKNLYLSIKGIKPPFVLGREGVGVIKEIKSAWDWKVGDEVIVAPSLLARGTFARYTTVDQYHIAKKPSNITPLQAGGVGFTSLTAWEIMSNVEPNSRVLVHGGAGAVGYFLIQLLVHVKQCQVVTAVSSRHRSLIEDLKLGIEIIEKNTADLLPAHSFDTVIDVAAFSSKDQVQHQSMSSIKPRGRYLTINGDLIRAMDTQDSVICGGMKAIQVLAEKKLEAKRKGDIDYRWLYYQPDGKALAQISKMIEKSELRVLPPETIVSVTNFRSGLDAYTDPDKKQRVLFDFNSL